jgi:CRISPR-associated endoribonuclease Cas6
VTVTLHVVMGGASMRVRVEISTAAGEIPWECVLKPGRAVCYDLLARGAPELGRLLHEKGWGPHGMVPFGFSGPVFPGAARRRGVYAAGGRGTLELGSPLPDVVMGWSSAITGRELIDWGGIALRVHGVALAAPPDTAGSRSRFRAVTPVVMKGSGRDNNGARVTRQAWVLPGEPEYPVYLENNLRRKAETLGLAPEVTLERLTWIGPKRSFAVGDGKKPGAPVEAELSGAPEVLAAIRDWGLGQANSAGFGWVLG